MSNNIKDMRRKELCERLKLPNVNGLVTLLVNFGILRPEKRGRADLFGPDDVQRAEAALSVLRAMGQDTAPPEAHIPHRVALYAERVNQAAGFPLVDPPQALERIVDLFLDPEGKPKAASALGDEEGESANVVPIGVAGLAQAVGGS